MLPYKVVTRIYKAVASNKVVKGNIDMNDIRIPQEVEIANHHHQHKLLNQRHQPLLFDMGSCNVRPDLGGVIVCCNATHHMNVNPFEF